jgi:hypothetical protein
MIHQTLTYAFNKEKKHVKSRIPRILILKIGSRSVTAIGWRDPVSSKRRPYPSHTAVWVSRHASVTGGPVQ